MIITDRYVNNTQISVELQAILHQSYYELQCMKIPVAMVEKLIYGLAA